jgi:hypothetical protein
MTRKQAAEEAAGGGAKTDITPPFGFERKHSPEVEKCSKRHKALSCAFSPSFECFLSNRIA